MEQEIFDLIKKEAGNTLPKMAAGNLAKEAIFSKKARQGLGIAMGGLTGGVTGMGVLGGLGFVALGPAGIAAGAIGGTFLGIFGGGVLGSKLATKANKSIAKDDEENKDD